VEGTTVTGPLEIMERHRLFEMGAGRSKLAKAIQEFAEQGVDMQATRWIIGMLDQGEVLLPYLSGRVQLPAKHIKCCQSSQHGIKLRVVRHLLAKLPGAVKHLFHL
jgi:hypothetical protein